MKILVIGANGFFGRHAAEALEVDHTVVRAGRQVQAPDDVQLDLLEPENIKQVLMTIQPDVIVQAAGVIDNNESAAVNPIMTRNLLAQIVALGLKPKIIISGSAAEYGIVRPEDLPIAETAPLQATSAYGLSKVHETQLALAWRDQHQLSLTVARIFNPIGIGMKPRFLISNLIGQVDEIKHGKRQSIEVSRLDTERDYLDIGDVGEALGLLVEAQPEHAVYNIGSGKPTSTGKLLDLILETVGLEPRPPVVEKLDQPEPLYASQADISRLQTEFGWQPHIPLETTIKETIHELL